MPGDFFLSCIRPRLEESEDCHFFQSATQSIILRLLSETLDIRYMHFPIAEWIVLTEQEVSEKSYEESPIEGMGRAGLRFF